jgi:hypothetical protein
VGQIKGECSLEFSTGTILYAICTAVHLGGQVKFYLVFGQRHGQKKIAGNSGFTESPAGNLFLLAISYELTGRRNL